MKLGLRFKRFFYRRIMKPNILKLYQKENAMVDRRNTITSTEQSPSRFDIPMGLIEHAEHGKPNNIMNRTTMRQMISNIKNIHKSYDSLEEIVRNQKKK